MPGQQDPNKTPAVACGQYSGYNKDDYDHGNMLGVQELYIRAVQQLYMWAARELYMWYNDDDMCACVL